MGGVVDVEGQRVSALGGSEATCCVWPWGEGHTAPHPHSTPDPPCPSLPPSLPRSGRKRASLAYVATYALSCVTKHSGNYWVLMVGRGLGGRGWWGVRAGVGWGVREVRGALGARSESAWNVGPEGGKEKDARRRLLLVALPCSAWRLGGRVGVVRWSWGGTRSPWTFGAPCTATASAPSATANPRRPIAPAPGSQVTSP